MPTTTVLSRVKSDFFAILVPGLFLLYIILSIFLAVTQRDPGYSILNRIKPYFAAIKEYWPLAIIIIAAAYLLGNLIRAVRVTTADELIKKILSLSSILTKNKEKKLGYKSSFPYPHILNKIKQDLIDSKQIPPLTLPEENCLYNAWNFWKLSICSESPEMFDHIKELESRVRLFAGMFWAGLLGIIGNLIIFVSCMFNSATRVVWLEYNIYLLFTSTVIFIMFGLNLYRVRRDEARSVFNGYLYLQKRKNDFIISQGKKLPG